MDPERWKKVEEIFNALRDKPPAERVRFIEDACGEDRELKGDVLALLAAQRKLGDFMATPPLKDKVDLETATALIEKEDLSLIGVRVGSYCLEQVIASGGMGTVYLAVRTDESFHQKAAIKLIRGGLQSRDIVRRFYRERQTLANLNHPNIAGLLDGGTMEQGHPYLVMEYIEGTKIDEYCDLHALNITERLKLFRQVCSAVQYAHGKLVVHRDIKPANILVTGDGVPKLLDFGIVKLLDPDEDLVGTLTLTVQRVMTPEYASPEQIRGETVSTSTDIFSMGIVLYELLTGHRPFRFPTTTSREVERIVCEEDPPRPSTVVTQDVTVTASNGRDRMLTPESVSRTREGRPERLKRRLAGDLDHIIMKALRKEPEKRYASAEQFSEDIRRHLEGLPVLARRGTWKYRAEKFIRRNRTAMAAACVIVLFFLLGGFLVVREDRREANLKAARELRNVLTNLIEKPVTGREELQEKLASEEYTRTAEELKDHPEELVEYAKTIVKHCENFHLKDLAVKWWKITLDTMEASLDPLDPELAKTNFHFSKALWRVGEFDEAEKRINKAIEIKEQIGDESEPLVGTLYNHLANVHWYRGDFKKARKCFSDAIDKMRSTNRKDPKLLIDVMVDYADFLEEWGDSKEAIKLLHSAIRMCERKTTPFPGQDIVLAKVYQTLGRQLWHTPRFMEAEIYLRKAMERYYEYPLDKTDPRLLSCMDDLAYVLQESGKYTFSDSTTSTSVLWRQAWKQRQSLFGIDSIEVAYSANTISNRIGEKSAGLLKDDVLSCYMNLWPKNHPKVAEVIARIHGIHVAMSGTDIYDVDFGKSEPILREVLENQVALLSEDHWKIGLTRFFLGVHLLKQNKVDEGLTQIKDGLTLLEDAKGYDHPSIGFKLFTVANICDRLKLHEKAEYYRKKMQNAVRKWPFGKTCMDCDLTRERDSRIDFEDDNLEKTIIIEDPLDIYSKAFLWIYGRPDNYEWQDFRDIENARILVNENLEQQISFNIAERYLYLTNAFQWVPFEIPIDWLKEGDNTFDMYITHDPHYKTTRSWEYNNLTVGIDTAAKDFNHSWWVGASSSCCQECINIARESEKPLPRISGLFKYHRERGLKECEGELMIFLELHRRQDE